MEKMQRKAALMITGAMKTAPTITILALSNLTPIDLIITKRALETHIRLKNCGAWINNGSSMGHCRIEKLAGEVNIVRDDRMELSWGANRRYDVSLTDERDLYSSDLLVYTDASVKEDLGGIGIVCPALDIARACHLRHPTTSTAAKPSQLVRRPNILKRLELGTRK